MSPLITLDEGADYLGVSLEFLHAQIRAGRIAFVKREDHGSPMVRREDLNEYRANLDAARNLVLDQLVQEAQDLGLGY